MDTKLCSDCHKVKPVHLFRFDWQSNDSDMRSKRCLDCADDAFWTPDKMGFAVSHHDDCLREGQWPGSCLLDEQSDAHYYRQFRYEGPFTDVAELRATVQQALNSLKTPWEKFCAAAMVRVTNPKTRESKPLRYSQLAKHWNRTQHTYVSAKSVRRGVLEVKRTMAKSVGWRE